MIAGLVERCMHIGTKKENQKQIPHKYGLLSLVFTIMTFLVAQLGLIPLVKTGYSYIGYLTIFVIIIPFVLHFICKGIGSKEAETEGECEA